MGQYSVQTGLYKDVTILKDTFFTPPFNVVEVRENKKDPLLELMIMSSSPGLFNHDDYQITINVKKHTLLNLQTQSYQRIYNTPDGARQTMNIDVEQDAYFSHLPHPSVPHKGAIYDCENTIKLTDKSVLIWGEILACGRKLMGESFAFKKYRSLTKVFQNDKLIYKDNLYLNPKALDFKAMGQYEDFSYQANFLCVDPFHTPQEYIDLMQKEVEKEEDILFGITKLSAETCVLRILGDSGEQLFQALKRIQKQLDKQASNLRLQKISEN